MGFGNATGASDTHIDSALRPSLGYTWGPEADLADPVFVQMGPRGAFVAPKTGRLYMLLNDNHPQDNTGSYSVVVNGRSPVTVPGTSTGTNSGLDVVKGDWINYVATGTVDDGGGSHYPPDGGSGGDGGGLLPSGPDSSFPGDLPAHKCGYMSLIGKIV